MNYEPQVNDIVDMFLTEHSETRIYKRFPRLRLKEDLEIYLTYCVSQWAEPIWAISINGGYIIGKIEKSKPGSYIKGIFIAQTALYNWQYKRSKFTPVRTVKVHLRRINSQIANKQKGGNTCNQESVNALTAVSNMVLAVNPRNLQRV